MFSYQQISRWLSFNPDPIVVEDWLANREVFGPVEKPTPEDRELEIAYSIEKARNKTLGGGSKDWPVSVLLNGTDLVGIVDQGSSLLLIPSGKGNPKKIVAEGEIDLAGEVKKVSVVGSDVVLIPCQKDKEIKIKLRLREGLTIDGKSEFSWTGLGKERVVFDARGRPLLLVDGEKHRGVMKMLNEL